MENLNMALLSSSSSSSPQLVMGCYPNSFKNPTHINQFSRTTRVLPLSPRNYRIIGRNSSITVSALSNSSSSTGVPRRISQSSAEHFASLSSGQQTSSVGVNPLPLPPPSSSSSFGSPLFWIGVGVGLSAVFTWAATRVKNYAMQQAFKTMMNQMNTQNNPFNNPGSPNPAFSPGSPFPFPTPAAAAGPFSTPPFPSSSTSTPASSPSYPTSSASTSPSVASQPTVTVDVPAMKVEAASDTDSKDEKETKKETKKYSFVDVSPEETFPKSPFESNGDVSETSTSKETQFSQEVSQNGAAFNQIPNAFGGSQYTGKEGSGLSVEALEKMMEDPTVQKMVYPYLPEEMRNPSTFKWMLQNPQYRQQLEEMLNNMSGSGEWDNRMTESLKNFDLSSPEVKQQFDQIGLTPEEVISKIMANPDVAMAFQNPRVQQAIMDCSQNPLSISKYQNDKEVMDVFNKISELFPGVRP
ncbi:protein TIC 40, chloroplastic isoform X2 [Mercurialis annua]|uniref:protein TIC 40, chloroplastic isoform X2 n=1 Tax=Mercurialis annua TaxID=3986 RepID=UPI00215E1D3F|nr:protein TIC 40, chloroplastic isoform X2 [Mercurialis annua]